MLRGELQCTLRLTERAKAALGRMVGDSDIPNVTAGIVWGKWSNENSQHFMIGLYDRATAEGWLVKSPDLEFIVVDDSIIEKLDGKTLDIDGQQISIA